MELLELRRQLKAKKPDFLRQDAHKVKRLAKKWRRPKGIHSKMRHKFKGYRKLVSKGYRSPAIVRGFSSKGLEIVLISNLDDLQKINAKAQTALIAKSVSLRKRLAIVDKANEINISIVNVKNQKDFKAKFEEIKKRKLDDKKTVAKAETNLSSMDKNTEGKEAKDALEEKKELDKLLTKPE